MTVLLATLLGSAFGLIAGIIPGIGMFATVAILYPWLLDWTPAAVIMFYVALISSSQYFGSITAIYLGIAGESSSYPSVIEGPALAERGKGAEAIWLTGFGSFVGTFVGIAVMMLAVAIGANYTLTTGQSMLLFAIVALILFTLTKNSWIINVMMLFSALALSHIGVSANDSVPLVSFGQSWLSSGISFFALAAGLICMKEVFAVNNTTQTYNKNQLSFSMLSSAWNIKNSILRGSVLGSIGGLVPGITTVASSHLSYAAEKIVHRKTYRKGHMPSIVSSETANNSGSITQLIPLLLFGIPITGSETIIYNILDSKGWAGLNNAPWELFFQYWWLLLIINLIALLIAVKFSHIVIKLMPSNQKTVTLAVFFLLAISVYWVGNMQTQSGEFDLIVFLISVAIAYKWPNINWLPFVFCMVIGDIWLEQGYRFYQLTFN